MKVNNFKFTKKTFIITLYVAVFVILALCYGVSIMKTSSGFSEEKNGLYHLGSNTYFYIDGVMQKGAFEYEGNIYFASNSTGALKTGGYYVYADNSNGLINADGYYNFDSDGKLLNPPTEDDMKKTGLIRDFDGEIRLYQNGRATYGGLVKDSAGNYYYVNSSLRAVRSCSYTISKTNDLLPSGTYDFDKDGKMIDPPKQ